MERLVAEVKRLQRTDDEGRLADAREELRASREALSELVRRREVEFEAERTLVVVDWGAVKYPRSAWTYDLERAKAHDRDALGVLMASPRGPGAPTA